MKVVLFCGGRAFRSEIFDYVAPGDELVVQPPERLMAAGEPFSLFASRSRMRRSTG